MAKHTVVTSMSREIYEGYGRDFLRTFEQHWPASVELIVFFDNDFWPPGTTEATARRFFLRHVAGVALHDEWMARIAPFSMMAGDMGDGTYNIQYDARQARKAFIECHAIETIGGKVFWIDADVIFHAPVTTDFLDQILPDDKLCCHLGRAHMYTESGWIGFNADHPEAMRFAKAYRKVFLSGAVFCLPGWHDCYAFDILRAGLPKKFFKDLAEHLPAGTMHPFVNSVLGSVADHRKGGRKKTRSTKADLVIERTEPYWLVDFEAA